MQMGDYMTVFVRGSISVEYFMLRAAKQTESEASIWNISHATILEFHAGMVLSSHQNRHSYSEIMPGESIEDVFVPKLQAPRKCDKKPAHVIFFPFPAQGHAIPALILAQRLVERGTHVTFVIFGDRLTRMHEALEMLGNEEQSDHKVRLVVLQGRVPPEDWNKRGHDVPDAVSFMAWQCHEAKAGFEELLDEIKATSGPPSCIISDNLLGWTQDAANRLQIPRYLFFPSPACILAGVFYVKALSSEGLLPLTSSEGNCSAVSIPGMPAIKTSNMHSYLLDSVPKLGHDFYVSNCLRVHEASGILINTFDELEVTALQALQNKLLNPNKVPIFPVGPLVPKEILQSQGSMQQVLMSPEERVLLWLRDQPSCSVLYVSFGSILTISVEQIHELAYGLEASEQHFLWVLRPDSQLSSPDDVLPPGFRSRTCNRGLVVCDWVPQLQILSHKSTGGFLTHCGWNSTIESVTLGVPMITFPAFSDQALNARMVVEQLQVGLEMSREGDGLVGRDEVERAVRCVMAPASGMRNRANSLMAAAMQALELIAPSYLTAFVDVIHCHLEL